MFCRNPCVTRVLLSRNSYCAGQKTQNARGTYERVQDLRPYRKSRGGRARGFGSHACEAPRPETSCQIDAPSGRATRADRAETKAPSPIKGCGTPVATAPSRTMSRVQSCVATDSGGLLRPRVGEGRNHMLRRGRCAGPVCEAVPTPYSYSVSIDKQNGKDRWRERGLRPHPKIITSHSRRQRGCPRLARRRRWRGGRWPE